MKLTPWFVNGEKPVRPGVYSVSCRRQHQTGEWYSHWDGKTFRISSGCIERANRWRGLTENDDIVVAQWRGLAEEPKQ